MAITGISSAQTNVLQANASPFKAQGTAQSRPSSPKSAASDGDSAAVEAAESRTVKQSEKNHTRVDKLV